MTLQLPEVTMSANALTVLKKRYLKRDDQGNTAESPEDLFWRVAKNIALMDILYHPDLFGKDIEVQPALGQEVDWDLSPHDVATLRMAYERKSEEIKPQLSFSQVLELAEAQKGQLSRRAYSFYIMMASGDCLPNSPALMNAGRDLQQLSACFVLPVEDSMASIFDSLKNAALIHQSGGGTGFAFSRLRPKNDVVRSTGGVASGPVSFMRVFNAATEAVKQGGTRRGANMGILRVDHPDILDFITCKRDTTDITNFNISVGITNAFMEAVTDNAEYPLVNPRSQEVVATLHAREVFELIVECAWESGEPGIVFLDRLNEDNPTPALGDIESTNPCGEQPLLPYEACCLASINLAHFVRDGTIDWERLGPAVRRAIHFLDNLIDANKYPLAEIEDMVVQNRKVGLGVMGWADSLIKMTLPYDSEAAVKLAGEIMLFIREEAVAASVQMAAQRGSFPAFPRSQPAKRGMKALRNATVTTIAPTGTISIIASTSSGIEPLFSIAFTRNVLDNEKLIEVNPQFEAAARAQGFYSRELMEEIAEHGSVRDVEALDPEVQQVFATSHDITPEWHVRMQAAFQAHTDNAVSKTVNFPKKAAREDVARVFQLAYELGCKGVTVYRDGSRDFQVLTVGGTSKDKAAPQDDAAGVNGTWGTLRPISRPTRLQGFTDEKITPLGKLFLTLNMMDGHPLELFAQIGKAGSDVTAFTEAIARLVSGALRVGVDPHEVADQLWGIGGSRSVGYGPNRVRSVPDAIGQFLMEYLQSGDGQAVSTLSDTETPTHKTQAKAQGFQLCPSCGCQTLIHTEGCAKCFACGYSEC